MDLQMDDKYIIQVILTKRAFCSNYKVDRLIATAVSKQKLASHFNWQEELILCGALSAFRQGDDTSAV